MGWRQERATSNTESILYCSTVPEGEKYLNVEVVNESPNNGGIVAIAKVGLLEVYSQGHESKWVQLRSTEGRPFGELKLNLTFNVSVPKFGT